MDGSRFDGFVRHLGSSRSRRQVFKTLIVAVTAGALGRGPAEAAGTCRAPGRACREPANCCSGRCLKSGGNGRRTCAPIAPGSACTNGVDCGDRPCYQGICRFIPTGQLCSTDKECSSGSCDPADNGNYCFPNAPGGTCRVADDCTTGLCNGGHCACAPANATCQSAADCCDRPCYGNTGTCRFLPFDQLCANDAECSSNNCQQVDVAFKACVKNGSGGFCRENLDCLSGQCNGTTCS